MQDFDLIIESMDIEHEQASIEFTESDYKEFERAGTGARIHALSLTSIESYYKLLAATHRNVVFVNSRNFLKNVDIIEWGGIGPNQLKTTPPGRNDDWEIALIALEVYERQRWIVLAARKDEFTIDIFDFMETNIITRQVFDVLFPGKLQTIVDILWCNNRQHLVNVQNATIAFTKTRNNIETGYFAAITMHNILNNKELQFNGQMMAAFYREMAAIMKKHDIKQQSGLSRAINNLFYTYFSINCRCNKYNKRNDKFSTKIEVITFFCKNRSVIIAV